MEAVVFASPAPVSVLFVTADGFSARYRFTILISPFEVTAAASTVSGAGVGDGSGVILIFSTCSEAGSVFFCPQPHPVIITQSVNALPATIYLIAFAVPFFMALPPFCKSAVHNNMHSIFTVYPVNYLSSSFSTLINAFCGISTFPTWRIRFLPSFCFSRSFFFREISPP